MSRYVPSFCRWSRHRRLICVPGRRISGAAIALAFLLGACTPGRINYVQIESPYDASQDHWVPYSRPMHADITGNPFPIPQDDFNRVVNAAIQAKGIEPSPGGYRIRMIFNGAPTNGNYICGETGQTGGAPGHSQGREITLSAAYCRGTDTMTFLQGSVDDISGPDDPNLRQFLRMVVTRLFPWPTGNNDNCMFSPFAFCR